MNETKEYENKGKSGATEGGRISRKSLYVFCALNDVFSSSRYSINNKLNGRDVEGNVRGIS
jgi:hypothetical protein